MELTKAKTIADGTISKLRPFCKTGKCEVAGSIRRGTKPDVHDIDIVCIPISQAFYALLPRLGNVASRGDKIIKLDLLDGNGKVIVSQGNPFCADIYIATEATWATLLLIRTGSKEHNVKLCTIAKSKGMKLHADGSGLSTSVSRPDIFGKDSLDIEVFKPCPTETAIFAALGLPYRAPTERE